MGSTSNKPSGKLSRQQAKKMLPLVRKFNSIGTMFVNLLQKKVDAKRKKVNKIRVLVSGMPSSNNATPQHNIQITSFFKDKFRRNKQDDEDEDDDDITHPSIHLPWKNTDYGNRNRGVML